MNIKDKVVQAHAEEQGNLRPGNYKLVEMNWEALDKDTRVTIIKSKKGATLLIQTFFEGSNMPSASMATYLSLKTLGSLLAWLNTEGYK